MADRAKKISELPTASGAVGTDYMVIVANTTGTATTKKLNFSNVITSVLSSVVAPAGQVFFSSGNSFTSNSLLTFTANGLVAVSNVIIGTPDSGQAVLHVHGAIASNLVPDTPNNYFIGSDSHPWGTLWVSSIRTANLSFSDRNIVIQMAGGVNDYIQTVIQNTSNGDVASTNYNVSSDQADANNNFGEFGINSSGFSGPGRFDDPLSVYLAAASSNLAIGTYGNYPVNIVVNSETVWTYGTDGSFALPGGPIVFTGSAATRADVNTQVGSAGSNGSIYLSTAGKMYLRVDGTGVAETDWQRVTTTAVD